MEPNTDRTALRQDVGADPWPTPRAIRARGSHRSLTKGVKVLSRDVCHAVPFTCVSMSTLCGRIDIDRRCWRVVAHVRHRAIVTPGVSSCRRQLAGYVELTAEQRTSSFGQVSGQRPKVGRRRPGISGRRLEDVVNGQHRFGLGDVHLKRPERLSPRVGPFVRRDLARHATPSSPNDRSGSALATVRAACCHASCRGSTSSRHATTFVTSPSRFASTRVVIKNV